MKQIILGLVLLTSAIVLFAAPVNPGPIGRGDYRAYWSASYLLRQGDNFSDPGNLLRVEHELTDFRWDFPIFTWNPPWLLVLLEPFTLTTFDRATWWWFLTNLMLVFSGITLLWRHTATKESTKRWASIGAALSFLFIPTFVALMAGQVNIIVLFGLAAFVVLWDRGQDWFAGGALALTMVKPHLVYVTLALVLLECLRRRRWRVLLGFFSILGSLTLVAWVQRPSFFPDYIATVTGARLLDWETPTLGGWLDMWLGWRWTKLIGFAVLPAAIVAWLVRPERNMSRLIEVTLILSIITAPFGWSYDQVLLLIPISHILIDLIEAGMPRGQFLLWAGFLTGANLAILYARLTSPSDIYHFWTPLLVAAVYFIIRRERARMPTAPHLGLTQEPV